MIRHEPAENDPGPFPDGKGFQARITIGATTIDFDRFADRLESWSAEGPPDKLPRIVEVLERVLNEQ
jgi:hypothetical protein